MNVRKIIGPVFFEEANSDRYVKLIPTQLFGELTQKKKTYSNPLKCKNWRAVFENFLIFQARNFVACWDILSAGARPAQKVEVSTSDNLLWNIVSWNSSGGGGGGPQIPGEWKVLIPESPLQQSQTGEKKNKTTKFLNIWGGGW